MSKILFLGGPSGSGKSHFAAKHLASLGWRHLEIDQQSKNGIDEQNLRAEWDTFFVRQDPRLLREELLRRADGAPGVVLSFPGNLIFPAQHIRTADGVFQFAYLFGHPAHCLASFLDRERRSGRGLDANHWDANNTNVFAELSRSANHRFLVAAFDPDGGRRNPEAIYAELFRN